LYAQAEVGPHRAATGATANGMAEVQHNLGRPRRGTAGAEVRCTRSGTDSRCSGQTCQAGTKPKCP
jgi:hypothetical protein